MPTKRSILYNLFFNRTLCRWLNRGSKTTPSMHSSRVTFELLRALHGIYDSKKHDKVQEGVSLPGPRRILTANTVANKKRAKKCKIRD